MLCINMLSAPPSFYLTGFCGNSIWKVIPSLSKWKTSIWGLCININRSTSCKVMKSQPQRISLFTEDLSRSPSHQEYPDMKSSSTGVGWSHRVTDKCSITFKYSVFSLANIYFVICRMSLLSWVLWHPNPWASVTNGSQSVVLQGQLRHGSLIRLRLISMGLGLPFLRQRNRIIQDLQQQLQALAKYSLSHLLLWGTY